MAGEEPEGRLVVAALHSTVQLDVATDAIVWRDAAGHFQSEPATDASRPELEAGLTWQIDDDAVYVADQDLSVWDGDRERIIASDIRDTSGSPRLTLELLLDTSAAYLAQQTPEASSSMALVRVDLTTGEQLSLVENRPLFSSLTQDAASLFFVEAPFRVARVDKRRESAGADVTLIDQATLQQLFPGERTPQPSKIATDAEYVYATINNQNGAQFGGVLELDKASGAITVLVRDELHPLGIAVDERNVYYTRNDDGAGAVVRIPKQGGAPEVIATRQLNPIQVLLTSTHVYWENRYGARTDPPAKDPELRSILKP